jgi:hypothetical protein
MNEVKEAARNFIGIFDRWMWCGIDEVEMVKALEELREAVKKQDEWEKEP